MKIYKCSIIKKFFSFMLITGISCLIFMATNQISIFASAYPKYDTKTDIEYTNGEGKKVNLKHKEKEESVKVSYELTDSRITRNATVYMSMKVKFKKSWSWVITLRDATCEIDGKKVTGKMTVNLFGNQCHAGIGGEGIDNWPQYDVIDDNKWHEVTIKSTPATFEIWIDGVRGKKLYFNKNVKNISSNYVCPSITMSGYNDGTIKDVKIWNNGKDENPVMPADRVTQSVEALPDVVALSESDIQTVKNVISSYNQLSAKEKGYVVNYDKLELLEKSLSKFDNSYELNVTGTKVGKFKELFSSGIISHRRENGLERYLFDTTLSRKSTFYIQCVVNLDKDSNCFDICLRDEAYKVNGKDVESNVSIRIFNHGALLIDQKGNGMSDWLEFEKANVLGESHIIVVESSPTTCAMWIDDKKYEFENINLKSEGNIDYVAAKPGINLTNEPEGTVSYIEVWNDKQTQNTYSIGDKERIAIYNLPELKDITLKDEAKVKKVRKMYNALSKQGKSYIDNLEQLEKAERAITFMKNDSKMAALFLSDELPKLNSNYLNLISMAKPDIDAKYNSKALYNAATNELNFVVSDEYMNIPFDEIQGIGADDTYMIKFVYKPYEYYYETETAAWMGLRITFSGYNPGGNGSITNNRQQLAFMVKENCIMSVVNNQGVSGEYMSNFITEPGKTYNVAMLCRQGRMKLWLNGKAVLDMDTLCDYPFKLEFESSRCRCDITDIQIYNMSNPNMEEAIDESDAGFKYVDDLLYGKDGQSLSTEVDTDRVILIASMVCAGVAVISIAVVIIFVLKTKRKKMKGVKADEE